MKTGAGLEELIGARRTIGRVSAKCAVLVLPDGCFNESFVAAAADAGIAFTERRAMPANNLMLLFRRT